MTTLVSARLRALAGGAWEFGFMNDATRHGPYSEGELAESLVRARLTRRIQRRA